jgi:hypothetical protein
VVDWMHLRDTKTNVANAEYIGCYADTPPLRYPLKYFAARRTNECMLEAK